MDNKKLVGAVVVVVLAVGAAVYGFTQFKNAGSTTDVSKAAKEIADTTPKAPPVNPGDDMLMMGSGASGPKKK